jgi:hypothetical protein
VALLKELQWITMAVENSHSHIGMQIGVVDGVVTLDLHFYLHCILESFDNP